MAYLQEGGRMESHPGMLRNKNLRDELFAKKLTNIEPEIGIKKVYSNKIKYMAINWTILKNTKIN
jgi:hypothetical protein